MLSDAKPVAGETMRFNVLANGSTGANWPSLVPQLHQILSTYLKLGAKSLGSGLRTLESVSLPSSCKDSTLFSGQEPQDFPRNPVLNLDGPCQHDCAPYGTTKKKPAPWGEVKNKEPGTLKNPVALFTNRKPFVKLGIVDHANHDDADEDQG